LTRGIVYILLVVAITYKLFYLVPWAFVEGSFNLRDISLVLIWVGTGWLLFSGARYEALKHPLSLMVLVYLFLIAIHISLARFNYDQSLLNGIVAARNQFIYVAFFLYVLLLDTPESIARLLDYLSVMAVVVLLLSVVNYFFPVVFHSWRTDEWIVERGGIQRVFMPATPLMNLAAVWMMCRWVEADRQRWKYGLVVLILVAGHFFNQSRGPIFGVLAAILVIVVLKRRFAELRYMVLAAMLAGMVLAVVMPQNILLTPFTTAVEDVSTGTGSIKGRLVQLEHDVQEFMEHPWIGSGLVAIRSSKYGGIGVDMGEMALSTRKHDLGYAHWMKMYGLAGIVWLAIVMYLIGSRSYRVFRNSSGLRNTLALFAFAFFSFIAITGITLNHFLVPDRIIIFMLLAAVVARTEKFRSAKPEAAARPVMENTGKQLQASTRLLRPRQRNVQR
jgi:hypothetical protein